MAFSTEGTIPPSITLNGEYPSIIQVGDSYADLGATVTDTGAGQAEDSNLGYKTFLNGTLVSNIVIDTSEAATETIDYVATDSTGLTALDTHGDNRSRCIINRAITLDVGRH